MGALIMTHSDDMGLVIPPKLAPIQVVICPFFKTEDVAAIYDYLKPTLDAKANGVRVKFDDDDSKRMGWKMAQYEMEGVPVRIGVGKRDMENGLVEIARRDTSQKQQVNISMQLLIEQLLTDIHDNLFNKALQHRQTTTKVESYDEFKEVLEGKGGFISAQDGSAQTEEAIQKETKATIRCIPLNNNHEEGKCIYSGKPSKQRVLFAKAY